MQSRFVQCGVCGHWPVPFLTKPGSVRYAFSEIKVITIIIIIKPDLLLTTTYAQNMHQGVEIELRV